jgi:DNA polymerase IV (DinB-like DNA polymerase)
LLAAGTRDKKMSRMVMHIDFDYFFAQCEEIRNPSLKTRPVVVCVFSGRTEDSGVVSTANYVARKHGARSGIPIKLAKARLAAVADAIFLPLDPSYYSEISDAAMSIISSRVEKMERVGIDECYIEVSEAKQDTAAAIVLAQEIRAAMLSETRLTCSVGVAPNKLVAKIASDMNKPDGLTVIEPDAAAYAISALKVGTIPGVGPKTAARLQEMQIETVGQLAGIDLFKLTEMFGRKTGTYIYNAARGDDESPVIDSGERKQISRIVTLKKDAEASAEMYNELYSLCQSVLEKAAGKSLSFRTVSVMLILDNLDQVSRSKSLKFHSTGLESLSSTARSLLDEAMAGPDKVKVRRLGVHISDLQKSTGQNTMSEFMNG